MSDTMVYHSQVSGRVVDAGPESDAAEQKGVTTPIVFLMAGFAGAGKTTLASKLYGWLNELALAAHPQKQLKWNLLSKDDLKRERLKTGIAVKEEGPQAWEKFVEQAGWEAFEELLTCMERVLSMGEHVIIVDTSNDKPLVFEEIKVIQERLHGRQIRVCLLNVLCLAPQAIRALRVQERGSVFFPYVNEPPVILDDAELESRFRHFIHDKNVIRINTDTSEEESLQEAQMEINKFLREAGFGSIEEIISQSL